MKQRTTAAIATIEINGEELQLSRAPKIEIEFSAIDTGGGFHDPMLDFSYKLEGVALPEPSPPQYNISLQAYDPTDEDNRVEISYKGTLSHLAQNTLEGMGRLKDEMVSRDMVKFVMRSVR